MMASHRELTSGRARRAIKITELASQVGSSYLWTSLRRPFLSTDEHERELLDTHIRNARRIVESSQHLRGAFLKLIQMLSMREDILPNEALEVLKTTHSGVPPMDYRMIAAQIRRELGARPEQVFAHFEPEAFAAASLGQVHRARLKSGEEVAVKVQYPGVEETVAQDLSNLKLLLVTIQAIVRDLMRQKIDVRALYAELEARLKEELNYLTEARNTTLFAKLLGDDDEVVIPRVNKELTSPRVLTMTYVDGYPLSDVLSPAADAELREWVAGKYFKLVWRQILAFGVLHTDPHPGNYVVSYHPRLGILDFGSIRRFPETVRQAHLSLAHALVDRDDRGIANAMVKLGYIDSHDDARPIVEVIHILFEPLLVDGIYDPADYDSVGKVSAVGEMAFEHKLYKSPAHSVFLLRALIGLEGIIRALGVPADYRAMFRECVELVDR
jgi:aarF domain-containing kinase